MHYYMKSLSDGKFYAGRDSCGIFCWTEKQEEAAFWKEDINVEALQKIARSVDAEIVKL